MSRRGGASEDAAGEQSPRERSDSTSSGAGSSGAAPSASPQFVALHSRVGKRYQAVIPELLASPADIAELLYKKQALQQPKPRYCPDKAEELGLELDKYLKLARSLRDGATFDTQEQVTTLALQHLHRFDYNTTDAACSLYARHSIELPRSTTGVNQSTAKPTAAEESKKWLLAFYRCMRCTEIDGKMLDQMCALHEKAKASGDMIPVTEAGVLLRLVTRILTWREQCEAVSKEKVDRAQLLQLLHQAEDMQLVLPEKNAVVSRLQAFDIALMQLKEALEHSSKRHQSKRVELKELLALFEAVMAPQLVFPEESSFRETVDEVKELKSTIDKMLAEDKVSLSLIRDVLAKIELVPVNFEQEVEQFQNKMHSAQTWLAKARKIMPNRRPTRRAGGADTKKMDLEAIRALVDDAPCENSTEMFEMQDLLECADVWAVKVKEAIDGGADVTLEQLKELLDEAKDIPVVMDEQKFLEAEIAAREWCTTAASKLASRTSIEEMEDLLTQAKTIRERIYPKKQSRWKPQVERDIGAAMDQSRKWINELRDNLGVAAFDKLFASLSSYVPSSHSSRSSSSATSVDRAKKKTMDAISKLIEKSQALAIDVSSYTTPLNDLLLKGVEAQAEASAILMSIGCLSGTIASNLDVSSSMDIDSMPRELGDLAQASALLEKIDSFPFTFEEGLSLASIVEGEKDWAARVRECIPPRQSRKKRLANDSFTTEQLHELLNESKRLRFLFRDELRILSKELHDLTTWRAKAHEVINGEVSASVANVVERLQSFDLMVYEKLQKAKKKLHIGDVGPTAADEESNEGTDVDMSLAPPNDESKAIKKEEESDVSAMDVDAEGPRDSVIPMELGNQADSKPEGSKDKLSSSENGVQADAVAPDTKPTNVNDVAAVNMQALEIHADSIMTHVRIESGCMQKSVAKKEEENSDDSKTSWMAKNGRDLLEPVLAMAEDSFETVNSLELKEAEARQTVEELVLAGEKGDITENITDESVRVLDGWKQQLLHVQKESDVLSVEAPEQKVIALIISLLEWLQGSRSLFYDEILPLQDLVAKGGNVMETLREIKALNVVKPATLATLERMLWPLAYLKTHEKVVLEWTERVHKCVADKHARVSELQTLLDNGSGLLLEQGAFKVVMDEAKKARVWLSKLKKRLRALITKGVGRMSMSAARSLVEEGEDIAIDMPVFDFLKEHLEIASDWENRVLASGIESGQARVANLLALLNEYECARLVIDLDMHRDVLKSATERYCICRQPFDGLMIGCDHCDDWFHDSCIGMSKEKAEKVEHYTCPSCTILQELGAMLQHTKAAEKQNNLWDMQEYARAFEKHQASALRKVKREEKTVERTEMLLFSCNNQMNQLRARIDDIERAKACLSIKPVAGNGALGQQQSLSQAQVKPSTVQPSATMAKPETAPVKTGTPTITSVAAPSNAVGTNALLLAAAAAASSAATASSSTVTTATSSAVAASTLAVNNILKSAPKVELATRPVTTAREGGAVSANGVKGTSDMPNAPSTTPASTVSSSSAAPASACSTQQQTTSATTTTTTATTITATTTISRPTSSTPTTTPASASGVRQIPTPQLLNPMAATLMGSTERLAALVVAGGVEQQLTKMKSEHVEASKQVLELQSSLRLSRERLANAQQALRELSDVFHARHRMLPYAQAWVRQAVTLLNTTATLSRANIDFSTFLPREYATALSEMERPPASASSPTAAPESLGIDKLFPGVDMYARLLRTVSWCQVVVSLLQERPSRCEISDAIAYALEYGLWEDKKTVTPLRSLIGRVDAWVSRAHKCMTKSASKTQQLSRLKALMNEYSKLPLTYAKTAEPLDVYVKLFTGGVVKSKVKNEDEALTSEAAEAAAVKTLDEAMVGLSPSVSSTASASNTSATKKQAPLPEEPSDEAIYNDRQQLEYIDGPALSHKNDQVDVKDESELWVEGEGEASRGETEGEAAENNGEVTFEEKEEAADEVNGEIAPWGDNETNLEAGIDAEEDEDDDGDAWEWQLRVVQRVSEGMLDLSLFTSGGFDFVVVLNVQHNALRDLRPIEGMAQTLRVLNASQNEIATLPSIGFWSQFRCLSMCFLSENALKTWADVQGLEGCARSLLWLTLTNNPLMALKNARIFVVNKLPFLKALDNFVTTDQEVVQHARPSARFNALAPRLSLAHLHMPLEFETDDGALLYVGETEIAIASTYADNSPSVRTQKLIRGYLSRRANFPRFRNVRELIIHVQKHIRGFLLRQLIKRQICELVAANGESKLLMASVAAGHGLLSPLARRSFERMLPMIRRWRTHFQAKKRAVAIKKIRFWCQMVYQRHARRTRQLLRDQQEIWIYYTPEFEQELLTLATRVARRDPYLMTLSREDRLELLRERCAQSGMSVLRGPNPNSNVVRLASTPNGRTLTPERPHQLQREEDEGYRLLRMGRDAQSTLDASSQHPMRRSTSPGQPALIRGFPSDNAVENQLLVAEKRFLQQDLEHIASIQSQHRQEIANSEVSGGNIPTRLQTMAKRQSRVVLLHLNQVTREIRQRLVICNRKILNACVKQQQRRQQLNNVTHFSLTKAKVRARGHAPTRWERKRLHVVSSSLEHSRGYRKMKVFIPWTIDMYLHIVASLDRAVSMCSVGPAKAFALSYEEAKRADAALLIQSAWRASICHSRRNALEVSIARALLCIQRWWRFRIGLRRRLDVLGACLLVGASINSRTLFMEVNLYRTLVESWPAVQTVVARHRCHEHRLHCRIVSGTHVELTLTPGQLLLHTASREERSILLPQPQYHQVSSVPSAHISSSKIELWSSQRCSAYLPVWMPGTPDPEPESMSSRFEDAAALLLVDGVQVEPTLMERELMLGITQPPIADMFAQMNPFREFPTCQRVVDSATRVMDIARRLSGNEAARNWQLESSQLGIDTSFVRLTFESIDEARKRALLLLCKTFDPITKTYARMFTLEALFGAAFRHHQWAICQGATREEIEAVLDESLVWMQDEFPSRWWIQTQQKLEALHTSVKVHGASPPISKTVKPPPDFHIQQIPPKEPETREPVRPSVLEPRGPPRLFPQPPQPGSSAAPVPLRVVESTLPKDAERHSSDRIKVHIPTQPTQPQSPSRSPSLSTPLGSSRHQILVNRLGKSSYSSVEDKQDQELQAREHFVRDLREEGERAAEALIVDRRMLQRQKATEVANIKLDIDVNLQRIRFERELDQIHAREALEHQRHATRRRKLTRKFETSFVAQSGALMRRAARAAVASSLKAEEQEQQRLAATVKVREAEALERRRDAKSFWFVRNRLEKREMEALRQLRSAEVDKAERSRLGGRRQRMNEDKEIKKLLHIM
ncbi:hypothetical protein PC128_g16630 [Phytophthora cactorum]|nr:hypothetical protein PC128_g16630 [Phytophthora cactorum]